MAKPQAPKEIKKEEGANEKQAKAPMDGNTKLIIINLASTLLICVLFISINYVLQSNLLATKLPQAVATGEDLGADETDGAEAVDRGIIVDLGDFILNLTDISPRKYLKVNVALEVSRSANDPEPAAAEGSGHGATPASSMEIIEADMAQFKPAIRDAVITTLSSKSSEELATPAGKELSKEQITESVNAIFAGDREVMRVSFGQFIIQ